MKKSVLNFAVSISLTLGLGGALFGLVASAARAQDVCNEAALSVCEKSNLDTSSRAKTDAFTLGLDLKNLPAEIARCESELAGQAEYRSKVCDDQRQAEGGVDSKEKEISFLQTVEEGLSLPLRFLEAFANDPQRAQKQAAFTELTGTLVKVIRNSEMTLQQAMTHIEARMDKSVSPAEKVRLATEVEILRSIRGVRGGALSSERLMALLQDATSGEPEKSGRALKYFRADVGFLLHCVALTAVYPEQVELTLSRVQPSLSGMVKSVRSRIATLRSEVEDLNGRYGLRQGVGGPCQAEKDRENRKRAACADSRAEKSRMEQRIVNLGEIERSASEMYYRGCKREYCRFSRSRKEP
jgi:hypothetical protein